MASILYADPNPGDPIPDTLAGLVAVFRSITSIGPDTGSGTVDAPIIQPDVPNSSQEGTIWFRTGDGGEPVGIYKYFSGRWCKFWNFVPGTICYFRQDPTPFFNMSTGLGLFNSGTPSLAGDFYGWKLRLGADTSDNQHVINRYVATADNWNGTEFVITKPDGSIAHRGDGGGLYIDAGQIPGLAVTGREYNSGATDTVPRVVVSTHTSGSDVTTDPLQSGFDNQTPAKFVVLPPFGALGMIEYIGPIYTDPTVPLTT